MPRALLSVARQQRLIKWIKIQSSIGFKFSLVHTQCSLEWAQLSEDFRLCWRDGMPSPRQEFSLPSGITSHPSLGCWNSQQDSSIPIFVLFDVAAGLLFQVNAVVSISGFEFWDLFHFPVHPTECKWHTWAPLELKTPQFNCTLSFLRSHSLSQDTKPCSAAGNKLHEYYPEQFVSVLCSPKRSNL